LTGKGEENVTLQNQSISTGQLTISNANGPFDTGTKIFYFALIIYPCMFLWAYYYPIKVGLVHLQVLIPTFMCLLAAFFRPAKIIKKLDFPVIAILWAGIILFLLQLLLGLTSIDRLPLIRIIFTIPLFWSLYVVFIDTFEKKQKIIKIIIWNCIVVGFFGILQWLFFPSMIGRTTSFLGGANVFANFLVVGLLAIDSQKKSTLSVLIAIFLYVCITLGASRWAGIFAIFILYRLIFYGKGRRMGRIFIFVICLIFLIVVEPIYLKPIQYNISRFINNPLPTSRGEKNMIGLEQIFNSGNSFFIGGNPKVPAVKRDIEFSDNSYILLTICFGAVFAFFWIYIVLIKSIVFKKFKENKIALIYFLGTLLFNNAILWDIWLLYVLGVITCSDRHVDV